MNIWRGLARHSALARNTFWMLTGQGFRLLIQAGCFVIVARGLGAANYGAFIGAVSLVGIVAPFANLGYGRILVKNVARNRALFSECWGNLIIVSIISACVLLPLVIACAHFFLPASITIPLVLLVSGSDLFAARITDAACSAFQATEKMEWTANINISFSVLRLTGSVVMIEMWRRPTSLEWGVFYCIASLVSAAFAVALVIWQLGWPTFNRARVISELVEGFHFATGLSAQTIYNDLDKAMLSRLSTLEATGIYAAAYRLIDTAFVPIRSLLWAANPSFFRAGDQGISGTLKYLKRLLPKGIAYSLLVTVALASLAPLVSRILGAEYARSVAALRWLAVIPILRTIHTFCADALTCAGYQKLRMIVQVTVAVFNVLFNLWVIPRYSWRGAVWSSLASDSLLLVAMCTALTWLARENESRSLASAYTSSRW